MNLRKLKDSVGQRLKLRPVPIHCEAMEYVDVDDSWRLTEVDLPSIAILENSRTNQVLHLSPDHIHNYTTSPPNKDSFDGFLELKVTVDITGEDPIVDIIPSGTARVLNKDSKLPIEARIRRLLDDINPKISASFDMGIPTVAVMISMRKHQLLQELLMENGASDVVNLEPNGSVAMGVGCRIGGHIHDSEEGMQNGFNVSKSIRWGVG
jgi:hypothetical protein